MSSDRSTSSTLDLLSTFAAKSSNGSHQPSTFSSLSAFQSLLNSESLKTHTSHLARNGVPASLLKHSGHSRSHHQHATQAQPTTHWTPPKTTSTSPISSSGNDNSQPKKRGPGRPPKNQTLLMTAPPTTHAQYQSKSKNPPTMVPPAINQHLNAALALANSKLNSDIRK
ncbi:unnamed protein product [Didymodactylos carnosus]|nr:unnamed protein product [Didymodactylos carnosus]CAF4216611.1 unnamed protein product [Didymodactylos carnosus]